MRQNVCRFFSRRNGAQALFGGERENQPQGQGDDCAEGYLQRQACHTDLRLSKKRLAVRGLYEKIPYNYAQSKNIYCLERPLLVNGRRGRMPVRREEL